MNVYVESNFVLELTLMQEEHGSCESILSICEARNLNLVIPAYCLTEPFETLIRRDKNRTQLASSIEKEFNQLGRSTPYKAETDTFKAVVSLLTRSGSEDQKRYAQIRDRLLRMADIIPLNKNILAIAPRHEVRHGLSPQDAIVYTSVLHHLTVTNPGNGCFLTRNSKDFADSDLEEALKKHNCKILFNFSAGYNYIQSQTT